MPLRPRWGRWAAIGAVGIAIGALPAMAQRPPAGIPQSSSPLEVRVQRGDTLWTLARAHGDPRRDVREIVARMIEANRVDPGALQPGMTLRIPVDCLPRPPR